MIDAYKSFMKKFNISDEQMIEFGLSETISIPKNDVSQEWQCLKKNITEGKSKVYIRGYGRDAKGTGLYMNLYKELFGHELFFKDPTNNAEPTKTLKRLTGYSRQEGASSKYKRLRNYQVSHIFGRTKNPYLFNAPWNIVYVPKIIDPFTGHESKGDLTEAFQKQFRLHFYKYYQEYIEEYNELMLELKPRVEEYLHEKESISVTHKFAGDVVLQFSPINIHDIK